MATVTGLTAARMLDIEAASVVDGDIVGDDLILTKHDGSTIDAGNVRGPAGVAGPIGAGAQSMQQGVIGVGDAGLSVTTAAQVSIGSGQIYVMSAGGVLTAIVKTLPTSISAIPAAANNRLDQIVIDAATGTISRLAGTSDLAGNTLANRAGAATIPAGSMLLHDILVTSGGVLVGNVRDRRPWARGYLKNVAIAAQTRNSLSPTNQLIVGTRCRAECTGNPIEFILSGLGAVNATWTALRLFVDGAQVGPDQYISNNGSAQNNGPMFEWMYSPASGSHLFEIQTSNGGGSASYSITAAQWTIIEHVRQNADNGLT